MTIEVGASASVEHVVGDDDTAVAVGSGDVPVLGTPRVVAWCEGATVDAVAGSLEPGQTSVGTRVELDHLRATPVGGVVSVRATVVEVDGRALVFDVEAADEQGDIARGRVHRVVVGRDRFLQRVLGSDD